MGFAPARRAQSFGLVGAAFGIGFIVGPAIGGLGVRSRDYLDPTRPLAAAMSFAGS